MTVLKNCTVGACFGRENLRLRDASEAARDAIAVAGLEDWASMLAQHLTIAGKKRLELARALAARPVLLLLDEVLAAFNPTEVEHMIGVIRRVRERGVTILIIEHLMQAIMSLSDRIVVLNFGAEIRRRPAGGNGAGPASDRGLSGRPSSPPSCNGEREPWPTRRCLKSRRWKPATARCRCCGAFRCVPRAASPRPSSVPTAPANHDTARSRRARSYPGRAACCSRVRMSRGCRPTSRRRAAWRWCRRAGNCSAP